MATRLHTRWLAILLLSLPVWSFSGIARGQVITEFPVPTGSSQPYGITAGPDGNLWFTENGIAGNKIGRITTAGVITEFPLPNASSAPRGIAAGPDGNLWFTEQLGNKIGQITTGGVAPTATPTSTPTLTPTFPSTATATPTQTSTSVPPTATQTAGQGGPPPAVPLLSFPMLALLAMALAGAALFQIKRP
jgi:hypothetical protein